MVTLEFGIVVSLERHVDPPLARNLVAEKHDVAIAFGNLDIVALEVGAVQRRNIVLAVRESFNEIPNHLGDEVRRARIDVVMRIVFEETDRSKAVTQTGITRHATGLLSIESVRRSVFHAWSIGNTNRTNIETQNVGIANQRLGQFDILLDGAKAIGIEKQLFHQLNILVINIIRLITNVGEIE